MTGMFEQVIEAAPLQNDTIATTAIILTSAEIKDMLAVLAASRAGTGYTVGFNATDNTWFITGKF